jgi:DMSO/TMAO reductase YedYZ heme-binding membrane subunit
MAGELKVHLSCIFIIMLVALLGCGVSENTRILTYVSSYGMISLILAIFGISVPLLFRAKRNKITSYLMANRRWLGIYTFIFALIHVVLVFHLFFMWDVFQALQNIYRLLGGIAILILALMTATSNNISIRKLGKYWKRLHYFVYLAIVLVIIHSFNIGVIFIKELYVKIIIVVVFVIIIIWRVYKRIRRMSFVATEN